MMEKAIVKGLTALVLTVLGGLGIIDIFEHRETNKKINMSMKELKASSIKDIQQNIVESAVKSAASDKVSDYISRVKNEILADARQKLTDETRKAVQEAGKTIREEVGNRISTEASLIDMSELKKSARDKAEAKILDKFDGNLEDLLVKFNDNLSNVTKIYRGIEDAISRGNDRDKGVKFTIGG